MDALMIGAIALAGWCGTVPVAERIRELLRRRRPVPPIPPFPFIITTQLLGLAGGVAAGVAYGRTFAADSIASQVLVSSVGALLGSYLTTSTVANLRLGGIAAIEADPTPQPNVR